MVTRGEPGRQRPGSEPPHERSQGLFDLRHELLGEPFIGSVQCRDDGLTVDLTDPHGQRWDLPRRCRQRDDGGTASVGAVIDEAC